MPRRAAGRRAPKRWASNPGQADPSWIPWWRELRQVYVPDAGGATSTVGSRSMLEVVHNKRTNQGSIGDYGIEGYAAGPAMSVTGAPLTGLFTANSAKWGPAVGAAFSVFAFVLNRSTSTAFQALIGNGFTGSGGWTFQTSYNNGKLGMTRWGVGDDATTTLPVVPNDRTTPAGIGVSYRAGGPARFFQNGQFEQLTSGNMAGAGIGDFVIGRTSSGGLVGMGIHVIYMWNRAISDGEFLRLYADPFGPIRPRMRRRAGAGASTVLSVSQVARETLWSIDPELHASQLLREAIHSPDVELYLSQIVREVLIPQYGLMSVSQIVREVLVSDASGTGRLRASQLVREALQSPDPELALSQIVREAVRSPDVAVRFSQVLREVLFAPDASVRMSQIVREVLVAPAALSVPLTGQLFPRGSPLPF